MTWKCSDAVMHDARTFKLLETEDAIAFGLRDTRAQLDVNFSSQLAPLLSMISPLCLFCVAITKRDTFFAQSDH
jgi:hypothetical protein